MFFTSLKLVGHIFDQARNQKSAMGGGWVLRGCGGSAPSAQKFCIFLVKIT